MVINKLKLFLGISVLAFMSLLMHTKNCFAKGVESIPHESQPLSQAKPIVALNCGIDGGH
jgi:hypothetical protein